MGRFLPLLFLFCFVFRIGLAQDTNARSERIPIAFEEGDLEVIMPPAVMQGIAAEILIKATDQGAKQLNRQGGIIDVLVNNQVQKVEMVNGKGSIEMTFTEEQPLSIKTGGLRFDFDVNPIPLWWSIVPPLLAIIMALVFREVISALLMGIFTGAAIIACYSSGPFGIFLGLLGVIDTYVPSALNDSGHLSIIVFSTIIGGIVAVISKNGGMMGIVNSISKYATNARSGQLATWVLGVGIFFDDYANTLVVGNTMRPVTDKLRISREKLSYLVDSTAAPIAAIAFVTTWIGAELGYIEKSIETIPEIANNQGAYSIFLSSLQYAFYPIFTLIFMLILILRNRDFGPMFKAEERARRTGAIQSRNDAESNNSEDLSEFEPVSGAPQRAINAVIPIAIIVFGTLIGLLVTGYSPDTWNNSEMGVFRKISTIIGDSDSYTALLWSSIGGLVVAILLTVSQRILSLDKAVQSSIHGFKTMLPAILILILSWSLALATEHLHTADFITSLLSGALSPVLIPALTFLLAALVAFSTGSSWGTMAILYPLMLPTCWKLSIEAGVPPEEALFIFYNTVSTVLAGSVLGDHCSPISDTTILSSLASQCNHIDHVRTQLPYALVVGLVATLVGTLPSAMGVPFWICFPVGVASLYLIVTWLGKPVPTHSTS